MVIETCRVKRRVLIKISLYAPTSTLLILRNIKCFPVLLLIMIQFDTLLEFAKSITEYLANYVYYWPCLGKKIMFNQGFALLSTVNTYRDLRSELEIYIKFHRRNESFSVKHFFIVKNKSLKFISVIAIWPF